jgi:hypothetical protein
VSAEIRRRAGIFCLSPAGWEVGIVVGANVL